MSPLHRFVAQEPQISTRDAKAFKTPEPFADPEALSQTSPSRPRLRLRKRAATHLNAPTQHFLESVAAADIPIPSIEEPQVVDQDMLDTEDPALSSFYPIDLLPRAIQESRGRTFSPPKTPAPEVTTAILPRQFPNWDIESPLSSRDSSPDWEFSRPSTARSSQTSASLFTQYSAHSTDISQCVSPEFDTSERFGEFLSVNDAIREPTQSRRSRRAPWTRQMSAHVWNTYATYLQDPKVTPFNIGKSGIPPHGVCNRVAREARRSWRQGQQKSTRRSATPTADSTAVAVSSWPHTCAATRAHLRELCKSNTSSSARGHRHMAYSPAPFGRAANRTRTRRSAPAMSPRGVFSSSDMSISLTLSTAESMQPDGPLAQLTSSVPGPARDENTPTPSQPQMPLVALADAISMEQDQNRLGSPFMAKSYGPSSSSNLDDVFSISSAGDRQAQTADRRRLASPARLTQSKPCSQKRRPAFLETRNRKRPSLGTDFWTKPADEEDPTAAVAEFSSTTSSQRDALFVPRANIQELFEASQPLASSSSTKQLVAPIRLGSPFTAKSSSHSVPNRFSSPARLDLGSAIRKPFATVQQASEGSSSKSSLQTRLAYIDQRLKAFRRRGSRERRSKSPQ
ncbi:hypothetical protein VHEMI03925 [[Torrubiella] hemipterigena]|uniref:Uncharacterized protein n=1 Tax=[Torrubiella] hemipterigena TaxID=1531966 RepID=A0A0A1STW3_9HYPO|nr:hypothetical protein VHEMI03925 [[Torrubiella] hemipterigena]